MWRVLVMWLACIGPAAAQDAVQRGEYLVHAGGCVSCHTVPGGLPFAGGRALATPFGTFYSPNITPDAETGIGRWTDAQFLRALREGRRPDGASYFPVFPYPSFTNISDADVLAIKAYLFSLTPVRQANRAHDVAIAVLLALPADRLAIAVLSRRAVPRRSVARCDRITAVPIWSRRWRIAANATRRATCWAR